VHVYVRGRDIATVSDVAQVQSAVPHVYAREVDAVSAGVHPATPDTSKSTQNAPSEPTSHEITVASVSQNTSPEVTVESDIQPTPKRARTPEPTPTTTPLTAATDVASDSSASDVQDTAPTPKRARSQVAISSASNASGVMKKFNWRATLKTLMECPFVSDYTQTDGSATVTLFDALSIDSKIPRLAHGRLDVLAILHYLGHTDEEIGEEALHEIATYNKTKEELWRRVTGV
jgi:hypothetical protein